MSIFKTLWGKLYAPPAPAAAHTFDVSALATEVPGYIAEWRRVNGHNDYVIDLLEKTFQALTNLYARLEHAERNSKEWEDEAGKQEEDKLAALDEIDTLAQQLAETKADLELHKEIRANQAQKITQLLQAPTAQ